MLDRISEILQEAGDLRLVDEDERDLYLTPNPPASEEDLAAYERRYMIRLPRELRELLRIGNGISLFGLHIMGIDELVCFPDHEILAFHNWGNGDFDCIAMAHSKYRQDSIVFMNHSPEVTVQVARSLREWLIRIIAEIRQKQTVLHPGDYRHRDEAGVYSHVLEELRHVDCELNR